MKNHQRATNIYNSIKRALVHNWEIPLSSDGYATFGSGNNLTSDGYGPGGFGNFNAWCILSKNISNQEYQFCIQSDGYMGFRIKYSKLGFTSGTGTLSQVPSATDEQILFGTGMDSKPIYQQITQGVFNFNSYQVNIALTTSTNILNFKLSPILSSVKSIATKPLPVVNKTLK